MSVALVAFVFVPIGRAANPDSSETENQAAKGASSPVDFNAEIRPIFTRHCSSCHGGVKQAAGLSFVYADQVLPPGGWVVEPGDPEASVLLERIATDDPGTRMPPPEEHPEPLPEDEIRLIRRWIAEGARWGEPWRLRPLRSEIPASLELAGESAKWPRTGLDRLVHAEFRGRQLNPAAEAPPAQWLRRMSLDLTGLPPSPENTRQFVTDCREAKDDPARRDAIYRREVDGRLASPHFGEHWAAMWMDVARYADSKGFEKDPHRDMWPYRDWLIDAFNRDLPYDEFTVKQLAGDLLPDRRADDLIATAFHRNTQTNTEGGTDDEEFRVAAVIDRINTTWTVWQGTTFGCTQCHSHPYDAYRQEEYYAFMALLNNTEDADLSDDSPTLKIPERVERRDEAVEAQLALRAARRKRNRLGSDLAHHTDWSSLTLTSVESSSGNLEIAGDEVRTAGGTFPVGVTHTVETAAEPMTALRLRIRPLSDDPKSWPAQGALLTQLKATLVPADGEPQAVEIADVYVDELSGNNDPAASLHDNRRGVGGYPKLHGPRWATFVLRHPLKPKPGDRLRLLMTQDASVSGQVATPIRRFTWEASDSDDWTQLLDSPRRAELDRRLAEARHRANQFSGAALPVMFSRDAGVERPTRQFVRGNWLELGEEVRPGIPETFASLRESSVEPIRDRLDFARWLVSKDNPLAARVWANRIWARLFGTGLVETLEDFGSSGTKPSHPGLLDHLASRIRDDFDWHLKPLLREIVLSSTYRQDNRASVERVGQDPENRQLARGPRTRMSAEMIRDHALFVSGLLTREIGGPSVMPPQPEGVWSAVYSGAKWETAEGHDRYRRGLYTYWRRTSPYPSFLTFDAPTRDVCAARRIPTNTPLQALVTMNDPVYVEASRALARRALAESGGDAIRAIRWMVFTATQRRPSASELDTLVALFDDLKRDRGGTNEASGQEPLVIVANTILNLDKALTK